MVSDAVQISVFSLNVAAIIGAVVIGGFHGNKLRQDYFSIERAPVKHLKELPVKDLNYWLLGLAYSCMLVFAILFATDSCAIDLACEMEPCLKAITVQSVYTCFKFCIYSIFALLLWRTYRHTPYAYPVSYLSGLVFILALALGVICFSFIMYINVHSTKLTEEGDVGTADQMDFEVTCFASEGVGANDAFYTQVTSCQCTFQPGAWWLFMYAMFDIGVNVYFCYLFVKPVRKLLQNVKEHPSLSVLQKTVFESKLLVAGHKASVISGILLCSTMISGMIYQFFGTNLTALDVVINVVTMLMLCPYYPNQDYYTRWCCLCIKCCDWQGVTANRYEEYARVGDKDGSVDTHGAVRAAALLHSGGVPVGGGARANDGAVAVAPESPQTPRNGDIVNEMMGITKEQSGK